MRVIVGGPTLIILGVVAKLVADHNHNEGSP